MKFYILDDLISAVKVLENIIESRNLGEVIGTQTSSEKAVDEIRAKNPDIVVLDLLMPVKDGITVVNEVKETNPEIDFVMVSQVVDKNMVSDAYKAGIEFFITKPNNFIEIENVLRRVVEKRQMASVLSGIRSVMGTTQPAVQTGVQEPADDTLSKVRKILGSVGMLGESGTKDIINVCQMMKKEKTAYDSKSTLNAYAFSLGEDPKIVKQRIRRAVKRGLTNTAALGIEDYYSDLFEQYAHSLFNFDAIRSEMDLLRGKSAYGGRPSIDKFFEGLQMLCEF
ncbi:MAG: DNA-binding domain-containing protein [Anaerovoracaceae bacterium]